MQVQALLFTSASSSLDGLERPLPSRGCLAKEARLDERERKWQFTGIDLGHLMKARPNGGIPRIMKHSTGSRAVPDRSFAKVSLNISTVVRSPLTSSLPQFHACGVVRSAEALRLRVLIAKRKEKEMEKLQRLSA